MVNPQNHRWNLTDVPSKTAAWSPLIWWCPMRGPIRSIHPSCLFGLLDVYKTWPIHIYIYSSMYVCVHMRITTYVCIMLCLCIYVYICTDAYIYVYIYISTYVYICLHMSIYVYIYMYYVYVFICIYIYESGQHNYASFCKPQLGVSCLKMCIYIYVCIYIYIHIHAYTYYHYHYYHYYDHSYYIYVCVCIHVSIFFCANYIPTLGTRLAPSSRHTRRPRRRWTKCRADCMAQQPGSGPPKKRNGSNDSNVAEKILHCQNIVLG